LAKFSAKSPEKVYLTINIIFVAAISDNCCEATYFNAIALYLPRFDAVLFYGLLAVRYPAAILVHNYCLVLRRAAVRRQQRRRLKTITAIRNIWVTVRIFPLPTGNGNLGGVLACLNSFLFQDLVKFFSLLVLTPALFENKSE